MKKTLLFILVSFCLCQTVLTQSPGDKEDYRYWYRKGEQSLKKAQYEQAGREFKLAEALCDPCERQGDIQTQIDRAYSLNIAQLQQALQK